MVLRISTPRVSLAPPPLLSRRDSEHKLLIKTFLIDSMWPLLCMTSQWALGLAPPGVGSEGGPPPWARRQKLHTRHIKWINEPFCIEISGKCLLNYYYIFFLWEYHVEYFAGCRGCYTHKSFMLSIWACTAAKELSTFSCKKRDSWRCTL